jgi:hypothetical protein
MRTVVHQAYFLPWLGYFSKLSRCQTFVVLDNVGFRKRHYQDRTRIVDSTGGISWLSLPVGENFGKRSNEVIFSDTLACKKLLATLRHSYAKAIHFNSEIDAIESIITTSLRVNCDLVSINVSIIRSLLDYLELSIPNVLLASTLTTGQNATERLLNITRVTMTRTLIVGEGKSSDVHDLEKLHCEGINIEVDKFYSRHPVYSQSRRRRLAFEPGLSIVDALLNVGKQQVKDYLMNHV